MLDRETILGKSVGELRDLLERGYPVSEDEIADADYRGISLGLPTLVERLTWKTFRKTFTRDPDTGQVRGYNVRMEQTGIDGPSRPRIRRGHPWVFGYFDVRPARANEAPHGALILDYGISANRFSPLRFMRDPLVALEEGSAEQLLGCSLLDVAGRMLKTPSFFLLEREPTPER